MPPNPPEVGGLQCASSSSVVPCSRPHPYTAQSRSPTHIPPTQAEVGSLKLYLPTTIALLRRCPPNRLQGPPKSPPTPPGTSGLVVQPAGPCANRSPDTLLQAQPNPTVPPTSRQPSIQPSTQPSAQLATQHNPPPKPPLNPPPKPTPNPAPNPPPNPPEVLGLLVHPVAGVTL